MVPPRLTADPAFACTFFVAVLAGCALGTCSGLTPGLHANNFALLLAAAAPAVDADPLVLGAAMLAAGVVHTFLDVVPSLVLGVPDAAMAAAALPGHRLVLDGRGREALRLSALGSGIAVAVAVPLALPTTWLALRLYPTVRAAYPLVVAGVLVALLLTEGSFRGRVGGVLAFALATALGLVALPLSPAAPLRVGGVLTPLFAGLFGAPVLLDALDGGGIPPQDDPTMAIERVDVGAAALAGTAGGAAVGYLPGVSAAVAAVLALPAVPGRAGARGFVVATSGANSATAVFALFALVALGTPRSGVLVAAADAGVPPALGPLLAAVVVAAAVGFVLVPVLGDRALRLVGRVDARRLSIAVLVGLVGLSMLFAGVVGALLFGVATVVGLVPVRFGARRVYLMGVLLGPLALG